ncbi:hypothetical protein [Pseudoroseomonas cervicalis]|uniref:hypothetical protein n=1 Tax=Teichococcus cervicalis TaxID=204525 RepID=UPI0022F188E7|nr:hypothetical protein [Pseudoroseomonas cervicalis]WBV43042.1 hypothetical protein PFY06_00285 [Pseudoroseomonas cervicalis]
MGDQTPPPSPTTATRRSAVPATGRRPGAAAPPSAPAAPPEEAPEAVLRFAVSARDELEGQGLGLRRDHAGLPGLAGATAALLLMLGAVTWLQAGPIGLWKGSYPHGRSFVTLAALLAGATAWGWLFEAKLLPALMRRATLARLRRLLAGETRPERVTLTLGPASLLWQAEGAARRYDAALLRGLAEDGRFMLLSLGFGQRLVLPKRDLAPEQQDALRRWAERHARGEAA